MLTSGHRSRAVYPARLTALLLALVYSTVLLHGLLPGSHDDHTQEIAHPAAWVDDAQAGPSPVCPHRLPELHLDGHVDCALCKLTRSLVTPDARSGETVAVANVQRHALPTYAVPSSLEFWQPASRRGPPTLS